MAPTNDVKVLETISVSPPTGSIPTTSLPLNFFDLPWFPCPPMHSLFLYEFPRPTLYFMQTALPTLKHSLSLTLQHFFPLAGNLIYPPPPNKPYVRYVDGGDSVTFSVAESSADFDHIKADYPRDVKLLHPFVPQLPPARVSPDGTRVIPIMALMVTVFPNSGICVGATHCHAAADGIAFMHFMTSWASVCKSKGKLTCLDKSKLPSHDRDGIKDPCGCEPIFLNEVHNWASAWRDNHGPTCEELPNKVRATFVLTRAHIERLRDLVMTKNVQEQPRVSTFVVTCALMWVCLSKIRDTDMKPKEKDHVHKDDNDCICNFLFAVDCRNRVSQLDIPVTYFGNCLAPGIVKAKKSELVGENGIIVATKAIGTKVEEMGRNALERAGEWIWDLEQVIRSGDLVSVSGSPRMRIYDVDFGWGRPTKVEYIHVDGGGALALSEGRDKEGGVEITLALDKDKMDSFIATFEQSIKCF